jgi:hypothetical protein
MYGICAFGLWVNLYSLDLSDLHATILPPEKEAVEDGWQISMISGAAQIKIETIVDNLVRARPRQWLRQCVEDYDDEDDYNDERDEKECIPQEGDAIPTQPGESLKKTVESGDYHVSANESEEEEEEEEDMEYECLDPLEEQDRQDKEMGRIPKEGLRGGGSGGSLVNQ